MRLLTSPLFLVPLLLLGVWGLRYLRRQGKRPASVPGPPAAAGAAPQRPNLAQPALPRPPFHLTRQDLAGIGTMELPDDVQWEREDNYFYNNDLGMVIVIRNQQNGVNGHELAYLESYNKVNIRDAPNWQRGPEQLGQVAGLSAARTSGSFDNGTAWVTRDYLFFAPHNTIIFQSRVPVAQAQALAITDYLAATFQPQ